MRNLKEKYDKCIFCENFYGPCYDEPLCLTCHLFIFPHVIENDTESLADCSTNKANSQQISLSSKLKNPLTDNLLSSSNFDSFSSRTSLDDFSFKFARNLDQKLENEDSGNEDSDDQQNNSNFCKYKSALVITCNISKKPESTIDLDKNSNKIDQSSLTVNKENSPTYISKLPNEVLLSIFLNLDDLSLWSCSQVCKKWHELVRREINDEKWKLYINDRWIFCKPLIQIDSYLDLYTQLVQSSNCYYCLQQIHNRPKLVLAEELKRSWRHKRLLLELKSLLQDPPDGINAKPLDSSCYYWQASITGPAGSPYEGGIFYLYLKIPQSYPLNPPLVRFVTKIYHPNISRHGDIGLDSLSNNWSLALTISKVLISIQSLLTDPYTHVCMEKDIGHIYKTNRELYEKYAKIYTWKYAMTDYVLISNDQFDLIESFETAII